MENNRERKKDNSDDEDYEGLGESLANLAVRYHDIEDGIKRAEEFYSKAFEM